MGAEVLCSLMLPQQQQSYNTAADELGAVETGRANPAVLNISADATATAQVSAETKVAPLGGRGWMTEFGGLSSELALCGCCLSGLGSCSRLCCQQAL